MMIKQKLQRRAFRCGVFLKEVNCISCHCLFEMSYNSSILVELGDSRINYGFIDCSSPSDWFLINVDGIFSLIIE